MASGSKRLAEPTPCLSVVMPCYNEASTVELMAERVLESPWTAELIIVDDGSTDETLSTARSVADPRVRVLAQPGNQGKGAALRRGFAEATARYVIVQDADLEYDPNDYNEVLAPLVGGKADVVFGSRFLAGRPHRVLYFWHALGNRLLTTASNMFTNLNLSDMETCYKAFRREVIQSFVIEEDRFGFEPEITAKVAQGGWRIYEVGISYAGRTYAEGKKIGWQDGVRAMYCIVKYSPLRRRHRKPSKGIAAPAPFAEADANLESTLESLDQAHNYAAWIFALIEPHLGREVLEIGAGHGSLTAFLAERADQDRGAGEGMGDGAQTRFVASEPSARCVDVLRARYADQPGVEVVQADAVAAAGKGPFDAMVMVNVLEHIEDDLATVRQLADGLKRGGRLILWVPAFQALYSDYDRAIGHHRRYRTGSLGALVKSAGLEVEELRYVNAAGAVAWWLIAKRLGRRPTTPGRVRAYDTAVVPLLRRLEDRVEPPFGQSVFCVARRPAQGT